MGNHIMETLILLVALLAFIGIGMIAVVYMRKRFKALDGDGGELAFTLDDLRQLHRSGKLSDEEYMRARQRIIVESEMMIQRRVEEAARRNRPAAPLESRLREDLNTVLKDVEPDLPGRSTPEATATSSDADPTDAVEPTAPATPPDLPDSQPPAPTTPPPTPPSPSRPPGLDELDGSAPELDDPGEDDTNDQSDESGAKS